MHVQYLVTIFSCAAWTHVRIQSVNAPQIKTQICFGFIFFIRRCSQHVALLAMVARFSRMINLTKTLNWIFEQRGFLWEQICLIRWKQHAYSCEMTCFICSELFWAVSSTRNISNSQTSCVEIVSRSNLWERALVPMKTQLKLYCGCKFQLLHLILHSKLPRWKTCCMCTVM